jgi:hypothetical protein
MTLRVDVDQTSPTLDTLVWALQTVATLERVTEGDVELISLYAEAADPTLRESIGACVRGLMHKQEWQRRKPPAAPTPKPDIRGVVAAVAHAAEFQGEPLDTETITARVRPAGDECAGVRGDAVTGRRRTRKRPGRPGPNRFNYWHDEFFNPEMQIHADAASAHLRAECEAELAAGNDAAFWSYLADDLRALEAPFVARRLQLWTHAGKTELVTRALNIWRHGHGLADTDLPAKIRRDQWIYVLAIRARRTHPQRHIAQAQTLLATRRLYVSDDTVSLVWREYTSQFQRWCAEHPHRPHSEIAFARALSAMYHTYRQRLRAAEPKMPL